MKLRILRLLQLLCIVGGGYLAYVNNHVKYVFYGIAAAFAVTIIRWLVGDR